MGRWHHRQTFWLDDAGNVMQVAVACLDELAEAVVEVTEPVGPFDDAGEACWRATAIAHDLGGWRAHQGTLAL